MFDQILAIKRWVFGAVVLSMTVANVFAATEISATLARISMALSRGDTQGAERLVTIALTQPGLNRNVAVLLLLDRAKVRELQDRLGDALADFSTAIESQALSQKDQINALLARGLLLDALNRPDDAIGDFSAVLQLDTHSANALNYRASIYRRQNRISEAQHDYLAALAADNAAAEYSYFGLGQIAEAQGDVAGARDFYTKALAANPKYSLASDRLRSLGETPGAAQRPISPQAPTSASASDRAPAIPQPSNVSANQPIRLQPPVVASVGHAAEQKLRPNSVDDGASHNGGSQVQLGVWSSKEKAAAAWTQAVRLVGRPLATLSPSIVPVDLPGKGQLFRLRVTTAANAADFCVSLKYAGVDCIPVKP